MRINTNVSSLTALEANAQSNITLSNSLEKLSTGLKINKASDDASGLSIADKLRTQANGLNQAVANGNSAVTLLQIADKAMAEQSNILDVIKQKLIQAGTATTSSDGIEAIAKDILKLMDQIDNIAQQTNYNGNELLQKSTTSALASTAASAADGLVSALAALRSTVGQASATTEMAKVATQAALVNTSDVAAYGSAVGLTFQMGTTESDTITSEKGVMSTIQGLDGMASAKVAIAQWTAANSAANMQSTARTLLDNVDDALSELNGWRADFGSTQNQLESSIRNLMTQVTNTKAAESVIRDVDYAQESATFNKQNIISQAGTYAISQANNVQQNVLRLLQ